MIQNTYIGLFNLEFSVLIILPRNMFQAMKGTKYCTWYDGRTKKLFMLDPDLITKIQVADFEHFTDLAFSPAEYIEVRYSLFL